MTTKDQKLPLPPTAKTAAGRLRRIGVELELGGLELEAVAALVAEHLGGSVERRGRYELEALGDTAGPWAVELDFAWLKELGRRTRDPDAAMTPVEETKYDQARDAFESFVIDEALEQGLPLLGICRGAQLLNVRMGGSLFQELRSRREHTSNRWTIFPLKTLLVEPGTRLHGRLGAERTRINSLHSQGIDALGEGLQVSGRDLDGIVQAVEAPERDFLMGVQWHPEFLLYSARQRRLFRALVAAAERRRG
jgi:putative glutamine amidotransferase